MIEFNGVSFSYQIDAERLILDDLSFTIEDGEKLAIIGGNGSGKTTLGLLMTGIIQPLKGSIRINGSLIDESYDRSSVGFLFQDPDNGLVATTVEREVAFSLENRGVDTDTMRGTVAEILERFSMSEISRKLIWQLSGGEKQKLSLAGILAVGSSILFLDEPASYLDYDGTRRFEEHLNQMQIEDENLTIIRVTQYPSVAAAYPRLLHLQEGKIIADGSPRSVYADTGRIIDSGLRPPLKYIANEDIVIPSQLEITNKPGSISCELNRVRFGYDEKDKPVICDLTACFYEGEVVALVGPSGCGKSTLAQLICGLYKPADGQIKCTDANIPPVMTFQQPERQFYMENCFEEVACGIKDIIPDEQKRRRAVFEAMELVGMSGELYAGRDPHSLSGGEARRLAFAVIIALNRQIIIFDEPTCALDENGVKAFVSLAGRLRSEGRTVVLISHNSDIIGELADRVMVMGEGRIIGISKTCEYFKNGDYKGLLPEAEVITYQKERWNEIVTTRLSDIYAG